MTSPQPAGRPVTATSGARRATADGAPRTPFGERAVVEKRVVEIEEDARESRGLVSLESERGVSRRLHDGEELFR